MHLIFRKKLHEIEEVLGEKNIKIVVSQDLENYIINNSNYFKYGARIIRRQIEQNIEDVVVNEMIQKKIKNNFTFNLDYNEKQGVFIKEKNKV